MRDFIAIDFETANPKRVSACAIGYARVTDGEIVETNGYLIKPVGGHASFQSKIHGIKEEHTRDKPEFGELFPVIQDIFGHPLVAHSLFDKQVLRALADHFNLSLEFDYTDSSSIAKKHLPTLKNHKLKTLVKHFQLPAFRHHDATEDAVACARIFLRLQKQGEEVQGSRSDEMAEFKGMVLGILADDEVNYKEAYQLLYWLEDHEDVADQYGHLHAEIQGVLMDDHLDNDEEARLIEMLKNTLRDME